MRSFETRGPVYPEDNYVVARTDELTGFIFHVIQYYSARNVLES